MTIDDSHLPARRAAPRPQYYYVVRPLWEIAKYNMRLEFGCLRCGIWENGETCAGAPAGATRQFPVKEVVKETIRDFHDERFWATNNQGWFTILFKKPGTVCGRLV
ncbi:hypothetical protein EVAR_51295_1 [Eumeta japonica]|uniref:Uncharacterized protein n=1 Tax=Eumeta variegata TaxID=151549 RepID=A0A4C1XQB3_EUMVA|nr:hypothetical protein EVAR_51295_1 [Eumeta japonica]